MSSNPELDLRESYETKYGFHDADQFVFKSRKGLDRAPDCGVDRLRPTTREHNLARPDAEQLGDTRP